jgi:hypothetical protein
MRRYGESTFSYSIPDSLSPRLVGFLRVLYFNKVCGEDENTLRKSGA